MARAICVVAALGAVACGSDVPTEVPTTPVATVEVTPLTGSLWVADTLRFTAVVRAADGGELTDRRIAWSTSDDSVASVNANGRVTGAGAGTVTVRATVDSVVAEATITVTALDLLYEGYADSVPELFIIASGTYEPSRVFFPGTIVMDPTPSPDGRRILYTVADYASGTGDVWVAGLRTGLSRQLTTDDALDDSPAWSPDGTALAFRSYRSGYLGEIWVVNLDGTGLVNLTPTIAAAVIDYRAPTWSPDGTRIAYASTEGGDWGIWTMDPDGGNRTQLTNTPDLDAEPTWSPDGSHIAFRRSGPAGSDIVILDVATLDTVRIERIGEQRMPAWSLDGRRIAYVSHPGVNDQPEIYTMRTDGSGPLLRTTDPSRRGGLNPNWRPRRERQ
jgi:Tol biopolymer transport system component